MMSHVTYANESCHMCEWVMSHMRISHAACDVHVWVHEHIYTKKILPVAPPPPTSARAVTSIWKLLSRTTESCHMHEWVMSRMSCRTWPSYMSVSKHIHFLCLYHHRHLHVQSHLRMKIVTQTTESCHICEWMSYVMYAVPHLTLTYEFMNTHTRTMSCSVSTSAAICTCGHVFKIVTRTTDSCHICEWVIDIMRVMPHLPSRMTFINTRTRKMSCSGSTTATMCTCDHIYEWVLSHAPTSHATHVNDSCHICHAAHDFHVNTYARKMSSNAIMTSAIYTCSIVHTNKFWKRQLQIISRSEFSRELTFESFYLHIWHCAHGLPI